MKTALNTSFSGRIVSLFIPGLKFSALVLALLPVYHAQADAFDYPEFTPSQTDFGGVGLIQMPSGRVAREGEINVAGTFNDEYHHYNVSLQLMPWLETTIRYTLVQDLLYSNNPDFSGDTKYTDKGIDFKIRLFKESYWIPETSIGVRDFGGTGLFDGEYIAASKHIGPFDITLGIGWGYLGNSANLYGDKSKSEDCGRNTGTKGRGGSVDFDRWFTGCSAVFGGVEYQTPLAPLRFKVEYDGNDYKSDFPVTRAGVDMSQDSTLNYGVLYKLGNWGDLRLSYERGTTWTFGFNLHTNFNDLKANWYNNPTPAYQSQRDTDKKATNELSNQEWKQLAQDLHQLAGYEDPRLYANDESITVVSPQTKYRDRDEARERAGTILANLNLEVESYKIIETANRQPMTETVFDPEQFAKVANVEYFDPNVSDATTAGEPTNPEGQLYAESDKNWDINFSPVWQQSIGGAENFYLFNVGVTAGANYWLNDNFELGGSVYFNIYDNYDKFLYDVPTMDDTDLKRVRTLIRQYINDNPVRIDNLQLTWMNHFGKNVYAQAYGGYLEMMFGGVGGEVLYRPQNSNWALGVDLNYVVQRDPSSQLGFFTEEVQFDPITGQNYRVQTGAPTGHATLYYQPQWEWLPNTLFKVSAGQYLTEDYGVTVDFSKQFDSGVIAGAFVAQTNLSADEFGEGSYNKGFYLSIPFDVMTVKPSTNRATISWLPLTRDGGQMLNRKYELYSVTDARSPWYGRKPQ